MTDLESWCLEKSWPTGNRNSMPQKSAVSRLTHVCLQICKHSSPFSAVRAQGDWQVYSLLCQPLSQTSRPYLEVRNWQRESPPVPIPLHPSSTLEHCWRVGSLQDAHGCCCPLQCRWLQLTAGIEGALQCLARHCLGVKSEPLDWTLNLYAFF